MRLRFGLRGLLLFIFLASAILAVVSLKLQQDHRIEHAFGELHAIGMLVGINGQGLTLICQKSRLSDQDVERLLVQAESLRRPHDLGLSSGQQIIRIELAGCEISPEAVERLHAALPHAEIKR